jgi:hypothetical protein
VARATTVIFPGAVPFGLVIHSRIKIALTGEIPGKTTKTHR